MSGSAHPATPVPPGDGAFPATRWSMIARAASDAPTEADMALEHLCRQYWLPLYNYVRRQGRSHHEAEDCIQAFLARLLATDGMSRARRDRGRFRTFILTALRNFLTNEWHRAQAAKRGGGQDMVPLEFQERDRASSSEPADSALSPEQAFDRTWALGMVDRVFAALWQDYEKSGRGALFTALQPLVWGDGGEETLAGPAARLGMSAHAFTVALHRLRNRFGQRLRADIAVTVGSEAEVDEELRHLMAALSAKGG